MQFRAQQEAYRSRYPDADHDLVLIDGMPAGVFRAQRGPDEFVLVDITLLPENRNDGVGTILVRDLMQEAAAAGKPLRAHVQRENRAWRLWQRLGFRIVNDDGAYLSIEVPVTSIRNQ